MKNAARARSAKIKPHMVMETMDWVSKFCGHMIQKAEPVNVVSSNRLCCNKRQLINKLYLAALAMICQLASDFKCLKCSQGITGKFALSKQPEISIFEATITIFEIKTIVP